MLIIESKNVRIFLDNEGIIESIKCECLKDGIFYSANSNSCEEFFKEVRDMAFKQLLEEDKDMFEILLTLIEKDKENYEYGMYLLRKEL